MASCTRAQLAPSLIQPWQFLCVFRISVETCGPLCRVFLRPGTDVRHQVCNFSSGSCQGCLIGQSTVLQYITVVSRIWATPCLTLTHHVSNPYSVVYANYKKHPCIRMKKNAFPCIALPHALSTDKEICGVSKVFLYLKNLVPKCYRCIF